MNYGKSIVVAFLLFALFIGILVTVCLRQEVSLVTPDYYKEELAHGEKMAAIANARLLASRPEIFLGTDGARVRYENFSQVQSGSLKILRPGNQRLDHLFPFQSTGEKELQFDVDDYTPGLYRIQLKWKMDGKDYMIEQIHTQ